MPESRYDIVMASRLEGMQALRVLRWDFRVLKTGIVELIKPLKDWAYGMNVISDVTAVRLGRSLDSLVASTGFTWKELKKATQGLTDYAANQLLAATGTSYTVEQMAALEAAAATASRTLSLMALGIASAFIILPITYNLLRRHSEQLREEFRESEKQILEMAKSYEVYVQEARRAALTTIQVKMPTIGLPKLEWTPLEAQIMQVLAALGMFGVSQLEANRAMEEAARSLMRSEEEWELYRWAVEASRGAIDEFSDAVTLAEQKAEYMPQILRAIAEEATDVADTLRGSLADWAIFFSESEQDMLSHQADMESVRRRHALVMAEIDKRGWDESLDKERQALEEQLAVMEASGEDMEQAMRRRMGEMLITQIEMLMEHGLAWDKGWQMQKDVLVDFMGVSERNIAQAEQALTGFLEIYRQGAQGPAWEALLQGAQGMLPTWEAGQVTLPPVDVRPLQDSVAAVSVETVGLGKVLAELAEAGQLSADALKAAWEWFYGQGPPYLPTITKGNLPAAPTTQLPAAQPGGIIGLWLRAYQALWGEPFSVPTQGMVPGAVQGPIVYIENLYGTDETAARKFGQLAGEKLRQFGLTIGGQ